MSDTIQENGRQNLNTVLFFSLHGWASESPNQPSSCLPCLNRCCLLLTMTPALPSTPSCSVSPTLCEIPSFRAFVDHWAFCPEVYSFPLLCLVNSNASFKTQIKYRSLEKYFLMFFLTDFLFLIYVFWYHIIVNVKMLETNMIEKLLCAKNWRTWGGYILLDAEVNLGSRLYNYI